MSTATETRERTGVLNGNWRAGVVGGIAGALVMAVLVVLMNPPTIQVAIPALYSLAPPANGAAGMVVHLSHGAVLGVVLAGLVEILDVEGAGPVVGLGLAWGVVTWVGLAALLMPVWLSSVGFPNAPPFPNFAVPSLLWHVVYGAVLGGVYLATEDAI